MPWRRNAVTKRAFSLSPTEIEKMTDHKKKGDFDQARKHDIGGNKKAHAKGDSASRTGHKQNAGHGGHR
jgi:hypothetical protein